MTTPDYQAMWIRKTEEFVAFADAVLVGMAAGDHEAVVEVLSNYVEVICDFMDDEAEMTRLCDLLASAKDHLS